MDYLLKNIFQALTFVFAFLIIIISYSAFTLNQNANTVITENNDLKKIVAASQEIASKQSIVREIKPRGYVIDNSLFYSSDESGLSFSGDLEKLNFQKNVFSVTDWPGKITLMQNNADGNVISKIKSLIQEEGRNPENCEIKVTENAGNTIAKIYPKIDKMLTEEDLFEYRKITNKELKNVTDYRKLCALGPLDCAYDTDIVTSKYREKTCSKYAQPQLFKMANYFQFSTNATPDSPFVFVETGTGNGDAPWMKSLHFFSK